MTDQEFRDLNRAQNDQLRQDKRLVMLFVALALLALLIEAGLIHRFSMGL